MSSVFELTEQNIRLWTLLSYYAPQSLTHKTIYEFLYGAPYASSIGAENYIRVAIYSLRQKVGNIKTVRGEGRYYLEI